MLEKIITLENISLVNFLGVENENIKEIALTFPKSKIVSRGNEIQIMGTAPQILGINELLTHYHKYGKVSNDNIKTYMNEGEQMAEMNKEENVLIFGTRGARIIPKTANQVKVDILKEVKGIGFVELDEKDVVRHPLVKDIIKAYKNHKDHD